LLQSRAFIYGRLAVCSRDYPECAVNFASEMDQPSPRLVFSTSEDRFDTIRKTTAMMMIGSHRALRFLAVLVGPALVYVAGCGNDDGLGKRYPVSGKVTYKGQPVAKAKISFVPVGKDGHGAYGDVENGSFTLSTLAPGDGVLPGEYIVLVDTREIDTAKLKEDAQKQAAKQGIEGGYSGGAMVPQDQIAKARASAKDLIPGKYQLVDTTDLKYTVKPEPNKPEFELKD
jgi:hypothetical protein